MPTLQRERVNTRLRVGTHEVIARRRASRGLSLPAGAIPGAALPRALRHDVAPGPFLALIKRFFGPALLQFGSFAH